MSYSNETRYYYDSLDSSGAVFRYRFYSSDGSYEALSNCLKLIVAFAVQVSLRSGILDVDDRVEDTGRQVVNGKVDCHPWSAARLLLPLY